MRSVTALAAITVLVGYLRGFGLIRGVGLFALGMPLIALTNGVRVILSGIFQEVFGTWTVQGTPHEVLGYVMILVGLGLILLTAQLLGPTSDPPVPTTPPEPLPTAPPVFASLVSAAVLIAGVIGSVAAVTSGSRAAQGLVQAAPLEEISLTIGQWSGQDAPVPEYVKEMLTPDRIQRRVYRNAIGHELQSWVIVWFSTNAVKGYHHPDICLPSRGSEVTPGSAEALKLDGGGRVPLTVRRMKRGSDRQLVYYWTQEGARIWTDEDEKVAHQSMMGGQHRWIVDRLSGQSEDLTRIVILIGADLWGSGDFAEKSVHSFATDFAGEVYRAMPWALPNPAPVEPSEAMSP